MAFWGLRPARGPADLGFEARGRRETPRIHYPPLSRPLSIWGLKQAPIPESDCCAPSSPTESEGSPRYLYEPGRFEVKSELPDPAAVGISGKSFRRESSWGFGQEGLGVGTSIFWDLGQAAIPGPLGFGTRTLGVWDKPTWDLRQARPPFPTRFSHESSRWIPLELSLEPCMSGTTRTVPC